MTKKRSRCLTVECLSVYFSLFSTFDSIKSAKRDRISPSRFSAPHFTFQKWEHTLYIFEFDHIRFLLIFLSTHRPLKVLRVTTNSMSVSLKFDQLISSAPNHEFALLSRRCSNIERFNWDPAHLDTRISRSGCLAGSRLVGQLFGCKKSRFHWFPCR